MIRKEYIAPVLEVFDVEAENMIATSPNVEFKPDENYGDGENEVEWTNKRMPVSSPWNSSNWSTKE